MHTKKYKKRKLGYIPPEDWSFTNLGDVLESTQYGISTPEDPDGNYEMFKMNNYENGYMSPEELATVSIDKDEFEKYRLNKGDLLFNRTNSHELVGKTGIFNLEG
ncbi:restriction endonuclease subunit S [Aliifodinibius sp. S!AR15-10]|uniref:restriction endonuclease subunit S n=1 Tax=Aliifodinibius sp. S!AR15-10 TaxID=2950437 RepID=UPI0028601622|nr:restriction endonuclease subunit S [Aliifodinibius sp. S!AR15-10]MDR8394460.1 restriction endonuclease subunit S [Aliifodinibius sp. S!AR15-10]